MDEKADSMPEIRRKKTPAMVKMTAALAALTGCLTPDARQNSAPVEGDPSQTPPAQKWETEPPKEKKNALPHRPPPSRTRWRHATKLFAVNENPGEDEPGRGI